MSEPRIVPPEMVKAIAAGVYTLSRREYIDLAHTVAVLGEQREAGRALHRGSHWCSDANGRAYFDRDHTCPTARALGVTE